MNTSTCFSQVPKTDVFAAGVNHVDDIKSTTEYLMVNVGIDHHSDYVDDDNGQNLHLVKTPQLFFQQSFGEIKNSEFTIQESTQFGEYKANKIPYVSYDIIIPPPKLQA